MKEHEVGAVATAARHLPCLHTNTLPTIHVVSLHSTDYMASALSVCLWVCR